MQGRAELLPIVDVDVDELEVSSDSRSLADG